VPDQGALAPFAALERLLEGNRRLREGRPHQGLGIDPDRRSSVVGGQRPYAAVLGCADSRTAPEHVFDVGLGELFVCRTAGATLDELVLGSLELAVLDLGCPLLCVVGHSGCGGCQAGVRATGAPDHPLTPGLDEVVRRTLPAALAAWREGIAEEEWVDTCSRTNVALVCRQVLERSPSLAALAREGRLGVAGMWYELSSARVDLVVPPAGWGG
jgi:carbonic anhydrase